MTRQPGHGSAGASTGGAPRLLAGVRVVDFTELLPGPLATQTLADLGADVVKVERPSGDPIRAMMPGFLEASARGKRSVALDLKHPAGRRAAHGLVSRARVVVEGWRPGVAARLGMDAETLRRVNPDLVHCSISGYGQDGPRRLEPAHDLNYVGVVGGLAVPGGIAEDLGTLLPVADSLGAAFAACAIAAALQAGGPHTIDLSLTEAALAAIAPLVSEHVARGRPALEDLPARPAHAVFTAADGRRLVVGATEDHFFRALCERLGLHELAADPELATFDGRSRHSGRIHAALAAVLARRPRDAWVQELGGDLPVTPAHDFDEVLADPQLRAREALLVGTEDGDRPHVRASFPARIDGSRAGHALPGAPALGEHTVELLAEAGLGEDEIARMLDAGAARAGDRCSWD